MSILLGEEDPPAFRVEHASGASPFFITCDHAGNRLPRKLVDLGVSVAELATHVAWDIGAAGVARRLAERLDAFLITQTYSRLVIDANRPPGTPQSIVSLSERTQVPGNQALTAAEAAQRTEEIFWPYHARIREELDRRAAANQATLLVSLHSFTPVYLGSARAWHAGVLYQRDARVARVLLESLRAAGDIVVGDNEPYAVSDATDFTVVTHGEQRGLPHVELEIRQDLIAEPAGQAAWAERLAPLLLAAARVVLDT